MRAPLNRRLTVVMLHGFAAGIPYFLLQDTLQAWLTVEKIPITTLGLLAYAQIPYAWKFLWAPLLDRYRLPFLGRRRGWILAFQVLLIAGITAMALSSPSLSMGAVATLAVVIAFGGASHDVVVDAYRADVLRPDERGVGASGYAMLYRIAGFAVGGFALVLADYVGWTVVFLFASSCMLFGVAGTFIGPDPETSDPPATMSEALWLPAKELLARPAALVILVFVLSYKVDTTIAQYFMSKFLLDSGFSLSDLGAIRKPVGIVAALLGMAAGGWFVARHGLKRSLWWCGFLQAGAAVFFILITYVGNRRLALAAAVGAETFFSSMGTVAYDSLILAICDRRYSATQYALLSSLTAQSRILVQGQMGFLQALVGWRNYFLFSIVTAAPALFLLTQYDRWKVHDPVATTPRHPGQEQL